MDRAENLVLSSVNYTESRMVIHSRLGIEGIAKFDLLLNQSSISVEAVDIEQAKLAFEAHLTFGKGRHVAGLNICDCFAYGLAKHYDVPLLFKGNDFTLTDIESAL